jgi:hypothetical protein
MEKQTEKLKVDLARQPEFNLYQAFKLFERGEIDFINFDEFIFSLTKITNQRFNRVLRE